MEYYIYLRGFCGVPLPLPSMLTFAFQYHFSSVYIVEHLLCVIKLVLVTFSEEVCSLGRHLSRNRDRMVIITLHF